MSIKSVRTLFPMENGDAHDLRLRLEEVIERFIRDVGEPDLAAAITLQTLLRFDMAMRRRGVHLGLDETLELVLADMRAGVMDHFLENGMQS